MLDHVGVKVSDIHRSKAFYIAALRPLRLSLMMDYGEAAGFGDGRPFFWIGAYGGAISPVHVALAAPDRATVDAFYAAALAAGGRDNGAPGLRPQYHAAYYGAFIRDPDGHNVEAVCHAPA